MPKQAITQYASSELGPARVSWRISRWPVSPRACSARGPPTPGRGLAYRACPALRLDRLPVLPWCHGEPIAHRVRTNAEPCRHTQAKDQQPLSWPHANAIRTGGFALGTYLWLVQKILWAGAESCRKILQNENRRIAHSAFHATHVCSIETSAMGQLLLGQSCCLP